MKKILIITCFTLIVCLTPISSTAFAGTEDVFHYSPAHVTVFFDGKQLTFDQEPVLVENRVLVPLRIIAESLGAAVEWTGGIPQIIIKMGGTVIGLNINSDAGFTGVRLSQISFLEQPPVVINGRTMVSLRFIKEVMGASVVWDEKSGNVYISAGGGMISKVGVPGEVIPGEDNYYKLYEVLVGPVNGPEAEEAMAYVINEGLLVTVEDVQYTPIRFTEYGGTDTMVIGADESGRERAVWLIQSQYTGCISVMGSVYMDEGTPAETIYSKLEEKGVNRGSVKRIYIAPYEKDKICWFVIAGQENKNYYYCFDFRTGEIFIENVF